MSINFPKTEEEILHFWKHIKAFETQLDLTRDGPRFTFYDGPPFGTSLYSSSTCLAVYFILAPNSILMVG